MLPEQNLYEYNLEFFPLAYNRGRKSGALEFDPLDPEISSSSCLLEVSSAPLTKLRVVNHRKKSQQKVKR